MQAAAIDTPELTRPREPDRDVRLILHNVSWGRYVLIRELLEDQPGLRMTYLEGTLEIMSRSRQHEREKKVVARLIEAWALLRRVHLNGYGSTTFRRESKERGGEPDECYVIGRAHADDSDEVPDIALEVIVSSGGIDKLDVYRGLGVPEVWFFRDGAFELHRLQGEAYERIERSALLPELDLAHLASFTTYADQTDAVLAYVDSLR